MALHNLVFVVDVDEDFQEKQRLLKRGILGILLQYGLKYGFDKVRWGYKFFQSRSGRNGSLASRGSDYKQLRVKTFEDFEQELDAMFDVKDASSSHRNRSSSVQRALKEVVLDFQWDQPDITSPTKVSLRPRRSSRSGNPSVVQEDASSSGRNFVFMVSKWPRSWTQLVSYLCVEETDREADVSQLILPKNIHDMMVQRRVVLHWVDSTPQQLVPSHEDNVGANKLAQVLAQVEGQVIPVLALMTSCDRRRPRCRRDTFTFCSSVEHLLSSKPPHSVAFPGTSCILRFTHGDVHVSCSIEAEPLFRRPTFPTKGLEVCLKGILLNWDLSYLAKTATESWFLHCSNVETPGAGALQDLLGELSKSSMYMFADVTIDGMVLSAVLSPLSTCSALLTGFIQHDHISPSEVIPVTSEGMTADFPEVVGDILEDLSVEMEDADVDNDHLKQHPVPEWADYELKHGFETSEVLENWFPHSDRSGVTSNLMESLRLMHVVQDQSQVEAQQELCCDLAELYQAPENADVKRGNKRSTHRTPVKQKMKTMSRALQMLNVARLNAKANKNQQEPKQAFTDKKGTSKSERQRNKSRGVKVAGFTSEADLQAHLQSSHEQIVVEKQEPLSNLVQQLLSDVKTFCDNNEGLKVTLQQLVQKHLLKSSKSIRQLYPAAEDVENKLRECEVQALLRLELCRPPFSEHYESLDVDEVAEEVADVLRIISLSKDPTTLEKFLQDSLLPRFLKSAPGVLANIYHNLGTRLPEVLAAALPADFFSDDSVGKDTTSPDTAPPPSSRTDSDCLQDLRKRSADKRRSGMLTRHRSATEPSQRMRQIEITKKAKDSKSKVTVPLEKPIAEPQPPKQETTEVTKVRRNLFNQESSSQSKSGKLPRSRSVSAMEGLKRKRLHEEGDRLRTNKVSDTPLHKQVSSRLLYQQKSGRVSFSNEECIVEESPVKPAEDLRRSPRIKKFARRHSSTFYPTSQRPSRNLDKALSSSQMNLHDRPASGLDITTVRSPLRLLFGAAGSPRRPKPPERSSPRKRLSINSSVFESPIKTPIKSPGKCGPQTPGCCRTPRTPKPPTPRKCFSPLPVASCSPELMMSLRGSPFRSPLKQTSTMNRPLQGPLTPNKHNPVSGLLRTPKRTTVVTPTRQPPMQSPLKGILRTPVRTLSFAAPLCTPTRKPPMQSPLKSILRTPVRTVSSGAPLRTPTRQPPMQSPLKGILRTPVRTLSFAAPLCTPTRQPPLQSPLKSILRTPVRTMVEGVSSSVDLGSHPATPKKCDVSGSVVTSSSPHRTTRSSPKTPNKSIVETQRIIFETPKKTSVNPYSCEVKLQRLSGYECVNLVPDEDLKPSERIDLGQQSPALAKDHHLSKSPRTVKMSSPSLLRGMVTRSGRTPTKRAQKASPCRTVASPSPTAALVKRTRCGESSDITTDNVQSLPKGTPLKESTKFADPIVLDLDRQNEPVTSQDGSGSQSDSRHLHSSQFSSTTDSDDMDIVNASVVRSQFSEGLKINISFSRKPSKTGEDLLSDTPKTAQAYKYGFRQTPDRQQREAAARLGYADQMLSPRFSTPRCTPKPSRRKGVSTQKNISYKVEMEMQTSGLPKLKFKRTDSVDSDGDCGHLVGVKPFQVESPLALCSKHRDPSCVSPTSCTPAKGTPGKGRGVQTHICQSYTPTRHPISPLGYADIIPLTPSPKSVGKSTPDHLNSWPRRKRAQGGKVGKDLYPKGEPLLEELLEEAELGVSRLHELEDSPICTRTSSRTLNRSSLETCGQNIGRKSELLAAEEYVTDELFSASTPSSSKKRKHVTASGILALTQSPLLFKGTRDTSSKRRKDDEVDDPLSPEPTRRPPSGRTYSRKRLIH